MCGPHSLHPILLIGKPAASGLYILRIGVERPLAVVFGRFRQGAAIALPAGDYLYIGSARGRTGASTLPHRLLRHATRSGSRRPHALRVTLLDVFRRRRLLPAAAKPPRAKRLRWHVDYLLDESVVRLTGVVLLSDAALDAACGEATLARNLAADPATTAPAVGLGASDNPGATHLLRITLDDDTARARWWARLTSRLAALCATESSQFP